jgi:6-pyruvoyl-tetrahydropterin synthase-like protein
MTKTKPKPKTATQPATEKNNKRAVNERQLKLLIALLCVGLSAIAVVPFFFMGRSDVGGGTFELRMPTTHDMFLHYDQMRSFYNGLAAGEIYPRWEEETNRGFGAPTTSYYPPGVYYLTSAFYAVTGDWLRALLDAHLVMMIAAAAALYIYARKVMGRAAALAAMAAYIFLPYHVTDQYQRGAIAELLVFVWMPLMLLFGERLMKAPSLASEGRFFLNIAGLAASYGAFLWSHPPTAYQFTLAFALYVLLLGIIRREWKGFIAVGIAMLLGIGLAAVYLLPAAAEQDLIHREYIAETWPYHKTYVFVHDLYNADVHRGFFNLIDWIWITSTAVIIGAAIIFLWLKRQSLSAASLRLRVLLWIVVGGVASFMMTRASMPIGTLIPKIDIGVFTWRMLAISTLVVALITGALAQAAVEAAARRTRFDRLLFASLATLIVLVMGAGFSVAAVARPMLESDVFEPEVEHLNWATIPSTAPSDPTDLPDDVSHAELATEDNGEVIVEEWKPQHRVIRANLIDDDDLWVRTFDFPGWTATVDGQQVPIKRSEELGDMEIALPAGSHRITLDFLDTPVRRTFKTVTLSSAGLLIVTVIGAFVYQKPRKDSDPA